MNFSFTSLGCASAQPSVNRFPSAHVLNVHERLFLIDCGEGCQMQLRKYGFSFLKLQHIFISHLHGDHIFGMFGLLSTMSLLGRTADIFVYAPKGFSYVLSDFLKYFGESFKFKVVHKVLTSDGLNNIFESKKIEIHSFPLNHRVDCYGFLFREKTPKRNVHKYLIEKHNLNLKEIAKLKEGEDIEREDETLYNTDFTYLPYEPRSFAYCSDTAPAKYIPEYIKGVDMMYHEATFGMDMESMAAATMHSTAADAAKTAIAAGAKKLIIGHFSSRYRNINVLLNEAKKLFPQTYIAEEGKEFDIILNVPEK